VGSFGQAIFHEAPECLGDGKRQLCTFGLPIALLRYPELSLFNKLRMAFALAWLKITRGWKNLERVTAEEWCTKVMGKPGFEEIWKPLLVGKFGEKYAPLINMAWLWSRLKVRSPRLGSYRGGFQDMAEDAGEWLKQRE